ncbi:MAG: LysM peptidoglycan-binding domain-containing protein [Anaerolineaceae bacterium]
MIGFLTPENAVFSIWQDAIHMKTMVGYASGSIGAGVASDGTDEYYAIDVRPIGESVSPGGNNTGAGNSAAFTPIPTIPVVPLMTSTSRPDGSLVHLVGYGQTLWTIADAYHITIDQIRDWNQLDDNSANIYAGQLLLVWPLTLVTQSATPTITPTVLTATPTRPPVTATPTRTATATQTPSLTPTPTPKSLLQTVKSANISPAVWGGGLLLLGAVLAVVFMRRGITLNK